MARLTSEGPSTSARLTPDDFDKMTDEEVLALLERIRGARSMMPAKGSRGRSTVAQQDQSIDEDTAV